MCRMSKGDTIEISKSDLEAMIATAVQASVENIAQGAAAAAIGVQRGNTAHESQLATQEQRAAAELGLPVPVRRPFRYLIQHCTHPRLGCKFDARIKVRDYDSDGNPLSPPVLTVVSVTITEWPEDLDTRCKLPAASKEVAPGSGKHVRFGEKLDRTWSTVFLQWVADNYTKALTNELASSKDPLYLQPYAVGEPVEEPQSETRRLVTRSS